MWVKPAPGRAVRDPAIKDRRHNLLPAEGKDVPEFDPFWQRRLRDGDVLRGDPPGLEEPAETAQPDHAETLAEGAAPPAAEATPPAPHE